MKKTWPLLLVLLFLAAPKVVRAQVDYYAAPYYYELNGDNTITITGYDGSGGDLTIPPTIEVLENGTTNALPVTGIAFGAFFDSGLTSVTIPYGVSSIGLAPFAGSDSLTAIMVDAQNAYFSSVNGVLFNRSQSTLVEYPRGLGGGYVIPSSVTSVADNAFEGCVRLTSVTIPANVTSIGDAAFQACDTLANVIIPSSVSNLGEEEFWGCSSLTSISIPASVTNIGDSAFYYCISLPIITIPGTVRSIGDDAFEFCYSLTNTIINRGVTSIGNGSFYECNGLANVGIPDSVTNIGYGAFSGTALTSITIPGSVTSVGPEAFAGCTSMTNAILSNGVTLISDGMFESCFTLTNVTIPGSVTTIGSYGFVDCTNLSGVVMPDSVTKIQQAAFAGCTALTNLVIPDNVTNIGTNAFAYCAGLVSITIGNDVTSMGDYVFSHCTSLTKVCFEGNAPASGSSIFGGDAALSAINYVAGTTGWGFAWDGIPTIPCTQCTFCQLNIANTFHQGDALPNVPKYFGFNSVIGQALTINSGCALCSLATMLTSFPGLQDMTPAKLDAALTSLPNHFGYSGRASINWDAIAWATGYPILKIDAPILSNATAGQYLEQEICGLGNAVILRLQENVAGTVQPKTHFVLVLGETNSDWTVFDPGWRQATQSNALSTLSGHTNGFNPIISGKTGAFRQFNVVGAIIYSLRPAPIAEFDGTLACPAEMQVADSIGRRLGYDPSTGNDHFEIPGGTYVRDYPLGDDAADDDVVEGEPTGIKSFHIPSPIPGTYQIIGSGTGVGPYTMVLQTSGPGVVDESATYSGTAATGVEFTNNSTLLMPPQITTQPQSQAVGLGENAIFTVTVTGTTPLKYQWRKDSTNLEELGNISGSTSSNLTISNASFQDAGTYSVIISNTIASVSSSGAALDVMIVRNANFQTGDLTGWTVTGDTNSTFVDDGSVSGIAPYMGHYELVLGTSNSVGYLSQTLSTTPGAGYLLRFWFENPYGDPGTFLVSWNGITILDVTDPVAYSWEKMQFLVAATTTTTVLQFEYQDNYGGFGLDDISAFLAPLSISSISKSGADLTFNAVNGLSGGTYYLLTSTNLTLPFRQWTRIGTNTLSASGNFSITATNTLTQNVAQKFYIFETQ
jgi:hypothetical protein